MGGLINTGVVGPSRFLGLRSLNKPKNNVPVLANLVTGTPPRVRGRREKRGHQFDWGASLKSYNINPKNHCRG